MPSQMPSSFASAAAGQGSSRDPRSGRGDGRGSGEWGRNNRPNGTLTLRRTSTTPFAQSSNIDSAIPTPFTEPQLPQATSYSNYEQMPNVRYGKNQLLDIFKAQENLEASNRDVSSLFADNWDPGNSNGTNGRGWGLHDGRDTNGPDVCWDTNGSVQPIGFEEMTELERSIFTGDVNSPLKPPPQNANKDANGQSLGANGRKTSVSHGQGQNNFGLSSPVSSRPGTRRQQTSDSITGLGSPATGRFNRDEPSFFSRRANDGKDEDRAEETKVNPPFGGLMRSNTAGSALNNGPSSPWGATPGSATMGSFGNFNLGGSTNPLTPSDKRPNLTRGESRLAHLMQKDSSEDIASKAGQSSWRSRPRTDTAGTDPFGDDNNAGSAALGGGQDNSPPSNTQRRAPGLDTPVRGASSDFGMSDLPNFRDSRTQNHQTPQGRQSEQDSLSPADTNPYGSPPDDQEDDGYDGDSMQRNRVHGLGGIPEHGPNTFGTLPRGFSNAAFDGSDRSQTSSVGATKGFPATLGGIPSLSNLGGMGGWPTGGNPIGTPDRENRPGFPGAFGNSIFGATGDLQSPGFGGLGGMFGPASSGTNTIGRGSKLGSLFPAAMQAQMQGPENDGSGEGGDMRQSNTFGTIGRNAFPRDTDSPMRSGRNVFEDLFPQTEESRNQGPFSSSDMLQGQTATSFPQASTTQAVYQQSQTPSDSTVPATQQRQMVMPDRMKWVYLDPQGHVQGPWSGLEMHDWYKASFFTPDLSVKKVEDTEFEPLGQLIRRIGNSREPFLVPQIGIPHGPPATQAGTPFTPAAAGPGNPLAQVGTVQPPFAGAFPSFGTTLTAEQQNNLERRKQEEQFLMARQREHLAQQQVNLRQIQMNPGSLHHHSSAHSLQSQPSFGSMTSPIGMPPQPPIPGSAVFFDGPPRQAPSHGTSGIPHDFFREEDLNRLSLQDRQQLFGPGATSTQGTHAQQINQLFGQNADSQREAARMEQLRQNDPEGLARLREFEALRAQHDLEDAGQASTNLLSDPIGPPQRSQPHPQYQEQSGVEMELEPQSSVPEGPSLTQQIQKAASAKQSPSTTTQPESPWAKVDTNMPMPFPPPPQSTTPLPAPTAQRGRSNLPEALNVEVRSRSGTPEITATPSVAPWAKEPAEALRGPSLKEIQEAEAKKAAKAEKEAAALRRAAHEQEMKMLSNQAATVAAGLPTTSTWGSGVSPATPSSAPSPWATASALKSQAASAAASQKKTLADIQREEESRKLKAAAAASQLQAPQGIAGGKRYADLASKPSASGPATGGPWATVGAGGKVKIPTGPAASVPQTVRAASSASIPMASPRVTRPTPAARSSTTSGQTGITGAKEEFNKWARATLVKGLYSNINVDEFLLSISEFPSEIIAESIYGNSDSMDGRRFAAEFERRRKLAEKGIIESASSSSGISFSTAGEKEKASGWSEVAKKGPPKEDPTAGFKVVPNKKKGKK